MRPLGRRAIKKSRAPDGESVVRFAETLKLSSSAATTQAEYLRYERELAARHGGDPPPLEDATVRAHRLRLKEVHAYSRSSMLTAVAAYYGLHQGKDRKLFDLMRPPSAQMLPTVLTLGGGAAASRRARYCGSGTLFRLIHACGLRIGKAVKLEVRDLRQPEWVHIREAKGRRERYVPLPPMLLPELRAWWRTHRHPQWLFPGVGRSGGTEFPRPRIWPTRWSRWGGLGAALPAVGPDRGAASRRRGSAYVAGLVCDVPHGRRRVDPVDLGVSRARLARDDADLYASYRRRRGLGAVAVARLLTPPI